MNIDSTVPPCTCIKFDSDTLEFALYDPFCKNDVTHRVLGSADVYPEREAV